MSHGSRVVCAPAVLAHAAYQRQEVQGEILDLGGIPLLLSQCQVGAPNFPLHSLSFLFHLLAGALYAL